ncbi:MAG TPA: hypothetical protein PKG54_07785 [Phycisphaerae bacterium]|jgi:hypothetical protein|nr:hypothetical protein [Phycisphaerae bacterium]HOB74411.1 hypothetical protein [Phycisphaerae bacterium]HOJ54470.1 hypothetical protein [Phycisphaerae bacterium]HOL26499.1 hypothetical protein [Phycisphaerae bacterium]HPP20898.1 hypothetical protein [Phycisphaerae bacterium]
MASWRSAPPKVWRFRIRGVSGDGTTVTLGRFETEEEARAEYNRLVEEGYYRNLKVRPVDPPPPPAESETISGPASKAPAGKSR